MPHMAAANVLWLLLVSGACRSSMLNKVIIDTDAGGDDAVAILLATKLPKYVDVIAITCVGGNTNVDNVVRNVVKTLQTNERADIPVYRGAKEAIISSPLTDNYFGENGFGDWDFEPAEDYMRSVNTKKHAAIALGEIISENEGEVTLVCLGPLTNIALAIRLFPELLSKLQKLVVLGASVEGLGNISPGLEFNFYMDPEAAYIVLSSAKEITMQIVPWETVIRAAIDMKWRMDLSAFRTPQTELMNQVERYQVHNNSIHWMPADAIATSVALIPSLVVRNSGKLYATVETHGSISRGLLLVDYKNVTKKSGNIVIVQMIDVNNFKKFVLQKLAPAV